MSFLLNNCEFCEFTADLLERCNKFSCVKDQEIEDYFLSDASKNSEVLLGKSYCFVTPGNDMVCAFTVSNSSIKANDIPSKKKNRLQRRIPHAKWRSQYPAVLVGQLAVFDKFAGNHIGDELMNFIKSWFIDPLNKTGCRYVIVDAVNKPKVIDYYKRNGFDFIFSSEEEEMEYTRRNYTRPSFLSRLKLLCSKKYADDNGRKTRLMFFDLIILKYD